MGRIVTQRDVDRVIAAKFALEEAKHQLWYGSPIRLEETSMYLANESQLKAIARAVGISPHIGATDEDGNAMSREVTYSGCTFVAPVVKAEW